MAIVLHAMNLTQHCAGYRRIAFAHPLGRVLIVCYVAHTLSPPLLLYYHYNLWLMLCVCVVCVPASMYHLFGIAQPSIKFIAQVHESNARDIPFYSTTQRLEHNIY